MKTHVLAVGVIASALLAGCGNAAPGSLTPALQIQAGSRAVSSVNVTTSGTWTKRAHLLNPGYFLGVSSDANGLIYAAAASTGSGSKELQIYNPSANAWTKGAPMLLAVEGPAGAAINGTLYVAGGYSSGKAIAKLQAYSEATNTWAAKAAMPTGRFAPAAATINGLLYVVGGATGNTTASTRLNALQAYNPSTNTWQKLAPMPTPRYALATAAMNGLLYAIGGNDGAQDNAVEVYDPVTNTWTKKNPFPVSDAGLAASVVNGTLYVVGGNVTYGGLWSYDPVADAWMQQPSMPYPRYALGATSVNNVLYAIGGYDAATGTYIDDISVYTP